MQLALDLGLDPTFLENIPEEYRREIIENEMRSRGIQQPSRQPENMDIASFIATVTDRRLRTEILAGLDEATLATLPPNLLAEARQIGDQLRRDRQQREAERQAQYNVHGGLRNIQDQIRRLENRMRGGDEADPYG